VCVAAVLCLAAGWGAYLSYGLPATIQLCTEWWMYEVVIFMAGELFSALNAYARISLLRAGRFLCASVTCARRAGGRYLG
jgi:hypothetical protein